MLEVIWIFEGYMSFLKNKLIVFNLFFFQFYFLLFFGVWFQVQINRKWIHIGLHPILIVNCKLSNLSLRKNWKILPFLLFLKIFISIFIFYIFSYVFLFILTQTRLFFQFHRSPQRPLDFSIFPIEFLMYLTF